MLLSPPYIIGETIFLPTWDGDAGEEEGTTGSGGCHFLGPPTNRSREWLEFAALGEGILKAESRRSCCGSEEKGVEKREEPKTGVEEVPSTGVEDKVPNAEAEDGEVDGDEKG
ncbi:unnamed protein product [Sphenostylis stenocarpa]|uniref:Uncharacterized protein n=1 Tax=Sphenostylis stenocarpa TaxID=92480 RepID=A0AA86T4Y9_9FABA|nr:unnamed protein product [Sphenostylis stenocarpa]